MKATLRPENGNLILKLTETREVTRKLSRAQLERIIAERNRNIDRMLVERDYYQGLLSMYESGK